MRYTTVTIKTEVEFAGENVPVTVEGNYLAGSPGARTLSNGDPGYPPDPPEVEICKVVLSDSSDDKDIFHLLPRKTIETLENLIAEEVESRDFS
jgi:hypothetical protein